jgi:hypothetical protein
MKNFKITIVRFLALLIALVAPVQLKAQHLEITPYAGYETGGKVYTTLGYLQIGDGMNFGGNISFGMDENAQFEFSYNHLNSDLSLDIGEKVINNTPLNVDYYMFGLVGAQRLGERFLPFYGGSIGWVHYGTPSEEYGNENLFTVDIKAGLKVLITEWVGIRLQARLELPMYYSGSYFGAGTGGVNYGVTSTCVMVQGDFTGGLFFVIE